MRTKEEIIKTKTISVFDELKGGHTQIMWGEVIDEYAKEVAIDYCDWILARFGYINRQPDEAVEQKQQLFKMYQEENNRS